MAIQPRPGVLSLGEVDHGGIDELELEKLSLDRTSIIDFSSNVNPFAPSPRVREILHELTVNDYPDRESLKLRRALAEQLRVTPDRIVVGNGSSELLWLIAFAYLQPGDTAVIAGPTYSEYARSVALMGAASLSCDAQPQDHFAVATAAIEQQLKDGPKLFFICNPNNPTGQWLDPQILERWAGRFETTLFVVDEAYIDFVADAQSLIECLRPNVIVLRSMTKQFGLAGLRLGYAIAEPDIVRTLSGVRIPWSVNTAAQFAGIAALNDDEFHHQSLLQLRQAKHKLVTDLESLGLRPVPSATAYFLLPVEDAKRTKAKLLQSGILVRDCTSFGLPGFIRIATRRDDENAKLIEALSPETPRDTQI